MIPTVYRHKREISCELEESSGTKLTRALAYSAGLSTLISGVFYFTTPSNNPATPVDLLRSEALHSTLGASFGIAAGALGVAALTCHLYEHSRRRAEITRRELRVQELRETLQNYQGR